MTIERLFTVEEVAKFFKVSTRTIFRWVEDGTFQRVIRIGGKRPTIRIPAEAIEALGVKINYDDTTTD